MRRSGLAKSVTDNRPVQATGFADDVGNGAKRAGQTSLHPSFLSFGTVSVSLELTPAQTALVILCMAASLGHLVFRSPSSCHASIITVEPFGQDPKQRERIA
jgi:hypothetical protein